MTAQALASSTYHASDGAAYEVWLGRWTGRLANLFLDFAEFPDTGDILDVGCGTGALLAALASSCPGARLAGVDLSPEMLAIAAAKLGGAAELREAGAEALPFADAEFDIVVSTSVFHYLRDPHAALAEMKRVLRPGGEAVVTDWCDDFVACRVCDAFLRIFNRSHFRTYGREECGRMLTDAGFAGMRVEAYKVDWLWGLMTATGTRSI